VVFDGSSQRGRSVMPSLTSFTSRGAFRVEGRVRGLRRNHAGLQMLFELFKPSTEQEQGKLFLNGANQLVFILKDSAPIIADAPADFIFRAQYDPAQNRSTLEIWNLNGTGYRVSTATLSNTSNFNMAGTQLTVAASFYNSSFAACRMDWMRMLDGAATLNTGPPGSLVPAGAVELWRYEFENNGLDSSGNAINLTLDGAPLFENTP
jgi:hypothetical protein